VRRCFVRTMYLSASEVCYLGRYIKCSTFTFTSMHVFRDSWATFPFHNLTLAVMVRSCDHLLVDDGAVLPCRAIGTTTHASADARVTSGWDATRVGCDKACVWSRERRLRCYTAVTTVS